MQPVDFARLKRSGRLRSLSHQVVRRPAKPILMVTAPPSAIIGDAVVSGLQCVYETGGDWVPGGEGRRTGSDPEGSSPKASPSGAQDHLVAIGFVDTLTFPASRRLFLS